jgi:hypothetical protein
MVDAALDDDLEFVTIFDYQIKIITNSNMNQPGSWHAPFPGFRSGDTVSRKAMGLRCACEEAACGTTGGGPAS